MPMHKSNPGTESEIRIVLKGEDVKTLKAATPILLRLFKEQKKGKESQLLVIDEAKWRAQPGIGQHYIVGAAMVKLGAVGTSGRTRTEIYAACPDMPGIPKPNQNSVNQHITKMIKAGLISPIKKH
jgi:hypothetical protein